MESLVSSAFRFRSGFEWSTFKSWWVKTHPQWKLCLLDQRRRFFGATAFVQVHGQGLFFYDLYKDEPGTGPNPGVWQEGPLTPVGDTFHLLPAVVKKALQYERADEFIVCTGYSVE
jgi:hypothetical protein